MKFAMLSMIVLISLISTGAHAKYRYNGPISFAEAQKIVLELQDVLNKINAETEKVTATIDLEHETRVLKVRAEQEKERLAKREACADLPVLQIEQCLATNDVELKHAVENMRPTVREIEDKARSWRQAWQGQRSIVAEQFEQMILALYAGKLLEAPKTLDQCKVAGKVETKFVTIDRPWALISKLYSTEKGLDDRVDARLQADLSRNKYALGTQGIFASFVTLHKRSEEPGCSKDNILATRSFALTISENGYSQIDDTSVENHVRSFLGFNEEKALATYGARVKVTEAGRKLINF